MALSTINTNSIADDAVTVPKVTDQVLTHRNLIINGAMQVAQRGTSGTLTGTSNYLVDRFEAGRLGGLADIFNTSQASDAPNGFSKSYKLTQDGTSVALSGTNAAYVGYRPEGQDCEHLQWGTANAKSVTVSFYVKSSITGTFAFTIASSNSDQDIAKEYTINSASTWEKKVLTIPAPTSGTWGTGTSVFGYLVWGIAGVLGSARETTNIDAWGSGSGGASVTVTANSTNSVATTSGATWQITGVQLEVGETATPFEHRSFGDELARCQRYFAKIRTGWSGDTTNGGSYRASYQNAVEMRSAPAATWTSIDQASFNATHTSEHITTYGGGVYRQCNSTNDARLYWSDATLDAEL